MGIVQHEDHFQRIKPEHPVAVRIVPERRKAELGARTRVPDLAAPEQRILEAVADIEGAAPGQRGHVARRRFQKEGQGRVAAADRKGADPAVDRAGHLVQLQNGLAVRGVGNLLQPDAPLAQGAKARNLGALLRQPPAKPALRQRPGRARGKQQIARLGGPGRRRGGAERRAGQGKQHHEGTQIFHRGSFHDAGDGPAGRDPSLPVARARASPGRAG